MKLFLKETIPEDIAYRIVMSLIYLTMIVLVVIPIGSGVSGEAIVFYRENTPLGVDLWGMGDVGHVGVAIQLEDGTWLAGAVEGPNKWNEGVFGTDGYNGGWYQVFKTKEDVIREFAAGRSNALDNILPHAAYDTMKIIKVSEINADYASARMTDFDDGGFSIWKNTDCYTNVYDVMKYYGLDENVLGSLGYLRTPKDFFNKLPGGSQSLSSYKPQLSSLLKLNSPLLPSPFPSPTSDTSPSDSNKGPYVPPTTTVTKVSYSANMPGNWIMYIGSTPTTATFTLADVRNEVLSEFPLADLSKIESMGKIHIDGSKPGWWGWWTLSETAPGVYEVYGMIGSPFSGTISETGLLGWVGADMRTLRAEKIGDSPIKKTVSTYNVPSNVAGVGPLGGGDRYW